MMLSTHKRKLSKDALLAACGNALALEFDGPGTTLERAEGCADEYVKALVDIFSDKPDSTLSDMRQLYIAVMRECVRRLEEAEAKDSDHNPNTKGNLT